MMHDARSSIKSWEKKREKREEVQKKQSRTKEKRRRNEAIWEKWLKKAAIKI